MAAKKTAPAKVVAPAASVTPAEMSWDLPEPEAAEYTRVNRPGAGRPSKDWEATTPAAVKHAVNLSWQKRAMGKIGKEEREIGAYLKQSCGTPERAEQFIKLARGYAKSKGLTIRGGADGSDVRFEVREFVARPRKVAA